jgi:hypothetical protein
LLNERPFDLEDGISLRLGIEAAECPLWSGVLLYAYTEGFDDEQSRKANRDALGPAWISITFNGQSLDAKWKHDFISDRKHLDRSKRLLFARPIVIDKPGNYRVSVRTEATGELASVVVAGRDDRNAPFHPWSPLLMLSDARHGERIRDEEYKFRRLAPARATYLGEGIALPHIMSDCGILLLVNKSAGRRAQEGTEFVLDQSSRALPTLLPKATDDSMTVSIDPKTLMLRIVPKERMVTARADWYFLARWWVNDKPYVPRYADPIPQMGGGKLVMCDDDFLIQLKLGAESLKAKRGDRIKLQLMYCSAGWLPVINPPTERGGKNHFPILTNSVTFTMP